MLPPLPFFLPERPHTMPKYRDIGLSYCPDSSGPMLGTEFAGKFSRHVLSMLK